MLLEGGSVRRLWPLRRHTQRVRKVRQCGLSRRVYLAPLSYSRVSKWDVLKLSVPFPGQRSLALELSRTPEPSQEPILLLLLPQLPTLGPLLLMAELMEAPGKSSQSAARGLTINRFNGLSPCRQHFPMFRQLPSQGVLQDLREVELRVLSRSCLLLWGNGFCLLFP